jgi:shikimate kinase
MKPDSHRSRNIFLVGPMAAGKTTIGRMLADELGLAFKDTDKEIENRTGADIPWIFDMEGEEGFRERERQVLAELTTESGILLATGGGTVELEENRRNLRSRGVVVFLDTSVELQLDRTRKDKSRPLLRTDDRETVLKELKLKRDPLYNEIADIRVFTGESGSRKMVSVILQNLRDEGYPVVL